ncbi:MAG: YfhO family protein [Lachnospiraceae bacterium]|nr:YfhO family protein [Lachnospiraceae bacterium]
MKTKFCYLHILTFFIPAIILIIIFAVKGIVPFGNNIFFSSDSLSQYSIFHTELADKLQSGDSLLYSFRNGMGTDFLVQASYYLSSPFNLILFFVPSEYIAVYFSLTVIIKLGLAGLFMGIYLRKHFCNISPLLLITFSCCYSLCSYSIHYYSNVMWLDGFMLFPIIVLSLEMLYKNKRPYIYSAILGLTIISNFYIGFMICIFCVLYYSYLLFIDKNITLKKAIRNVSRFFLYSVLAGGISAFIIIPAFLSLSSTISGNTTVLNLFKEYYPFYVGFFRLMFNASPTFMNSPYLHTSVIAFLLLPLFILNKNIDLKVRIGKTCLIVIMLLSFQFRALDYVWNGFHITKGFAGRQSFIFIFLMLLIIIEELINYVKKDLIITIIFAVSAIIMVMSYIYYDLTWILYLTIFNIVLLVLYYLIFKTNKSVITVSCIFICAEIILSTYYEIKPSNDYDYYTTTYLHSDSTIQLINDDSFFRIKNDCKVLQNEGCLLGYNSLPIYSSFTSQTMADTLMSLGYYIGDNAYEDTSFEPVTMSLLGIKYVISDKSNLESDILKLINDCNGEYIYLNRNCLPVGFASYNQLTDDIAFNTENPFETINSVVYALSGIENIYTPVKLSNTIEPGKDIYIYGMDKICNVTFKSLSGEEEILYPNSKILMFAKKQNYICHISDSISGGSFVTDVDLSNIMAYSLDHEKYLEFTKLLSSSSLDLENFDSSYISGSIGLQNDGYIFTSIPYSEGWTVKVDGKEVETYGINDSFLAFNIKAGKHIITFEYITKGLPSGSLISVISVIVLVCVSIITSYPFRRLPA